MVARSSEEPVDYFEVPPAHSGLLTRTIKTTTVCIYGIGHLGSWAARTIAALGVLDITVHDFDIVEERNISGSVYEFNHIADTKQNALHRLLHNVMKTPVEEFLTGRRQQSVGYAVRHQDCAFPYQTFNDFYILATDSAETRYRIAKTLFKHWDMCGHATMFNKMNPVIIDLRSAGATLEIVTLPLLDRDLRERYLKNLKDMCNGEGGIPCNESNIPQVPLFESAILAQTITSILRGIKRYYCYSGSLLELNTYPIKIETEKFLPRLDVE